MNILEACDYINGKKNTKKLKKEPFRADEDFLERALKIVQFHPTAEQNITLVNTSALFYSLEPDLFNDIPVEQREEFFYALKIGKVSSEVPAKTLFLLEMCQKMYDSLAYFPRFCLKGDLNNIFAKGHFANGKCLRDVICSLHDSKYVPMHEGLLATPCGKDWNVYVPGKDMIVMMPKQLKDKLSIEDIRRLDVEKKNVVLDGRPLYEIGGYIGAGNSTYDIRNII